MKTLTLNLETTPFLGHEITAVNVVSEFDCHFINFMSNKKLVKSLPITGLLVKTSDFTNWIKKNTVGVIELYSILQDEIIEQHATYDSSNWVVSVEVVSHKGDTLVVTLDTKTALSAATLVALFEKHGFIFEGSLCHVSSVTVTENSHSAKVA